MADLIIPPAPDAPDHADQNHPLHPQAVPPSPEQRRELRARLRAYVDAFQLIPPVPRARLLSLTTDFQTQHDIPEQWRDWCAVTVSNAIWEKAIRRIPRERRLLLLPFCIRDRDSCSATFDDLGLLCNDCGRCLIPTWQKQAEQLGMATLVAESSSRVAAWVEAGEIEAVIGVSCLDALGKAFPSMNRHAVPGYAIPLNCGGCKNTNFDHDELRYALALPEENPISTPPLAEVKSHIEALFQDDTLRHHFAIAEHNDLSQFQAAAIGALSKHGKHYRPLLTALVYLALTESNEIPAWADRIAIAVECFHKASLIHDDIEDDDDYRYGEETIHYQLGVPIAINVGDYLLGEGYRLLASNQLPASQRAELVAAAADGHCQLSIGQAREFELHHDQPSLDTVINTFRLKTAPAFHVAFLLGAIAAGKADDHRETLLRLSDALGVAYQLLDDLEDDDDPASLVTLLSQANSVSQPEAVATVLNLYRDYRNQAFNAIDQVNHMQLKILLARVTENILPEK